jgi:MFS family permease
VTDTISHAAAEQSWVKANLRRNFSALSADYGLFTLGLSLASTATIMPAFAERLGAPNIVIGAIPAVLTLGWQLPALFFANYIERVPRKLPVILTWTVWERLPFLAIGVMALTIAQSRPTLTLAMFILMLTIMSWAGGALMPAWMDLIGRVIPITYRGRFFAASQVIGGTLGLVGTFVSGYFLSSYPYPTSYALCFLLAFVALALSYVCLATCKEGHFGTSKPSVGMMTYLQRLPALLHADRNFVWYLGSRCLWSLGGMAAGFYTVFALKVLKVPEVQVAAYTFCLLAAQTAANALFGSIADRRGHKVVLCIGALCACLASLMAVLAYSAPNMLFGAFALYGASLAAANVSGLNISIEFCAPEDRPTYVGLASTALAPFAFAAPLLGGWLADAVSYEIVFWLSVGFSAVAASLLAGMVEDPRERTRVASA